MKVENRKAVRSLAFSNMKVSKSRNIMAVSAIVLTTLLFTVLSIIVMAVISGFEQSDFRMQGGYYHAEYKYLTKEQYDKLKLDKDIYQYGTRRILGTSTAEPLNKINAEVSYVDENAAKYMYIKPDKGRLPKENSNEAATDTNILSLLGVEPVIGNQFTITINIGNKIVQKEFILCGYWEHDKLSPAEHILVSESLIEELAFTPEVMDQAGVIGSYSMELLFDSDWNIEKKAEKILKRHGYQNDVKSEDGYVRLVINQGYVTARADDADMTTTAIIIAIALIIGMTGFLLIYSIFHISVINDIRRYGLLKTIGTTKRQLRRMVYIEATGLSVIGIPIGIIIGIIIGKLLIPLVVSSVVMNIDSTMLNIEISPVSLLAAILFSFVTVMISCKKPARIAGNIPPVEAVRYMSGNGYKKKSRKKKKTKINTKRQAIGQKIVIYKNQFMKNEIKVSKSNGLSITGMAFANLRKNRGRTVIVILSLIMPLLLFNLTVDITNGFNMDRFLKIIPVDYMVGSAAQINGYHLFDSDAAISKDIVNEIKAGTSEFAKDGGITYATVDDASVYEYISEEWFRRLLDGNPKENIDYWVERSEKKENLIEMGASIMGMEEFCLSKLRVVDGDIKKLYEDGNYIAALYLEDELGNPDSRTNWASVGDTVNVRYVYEEEYYNPDTDEVYEESELEDLAEDTPVGVRSKKYEDKKYEVAAVVTIPFTMNITNSGLDTFVLTAKQYLKDSNSDAILYYAFDLKNLEQGKHKQYYETDNKRNARLWLEEFTNDIHSECSYTGKEIYIKEFNSFRRMFMVLGITLSFIVGIIGILNFFNTVYTSVVVRNREFAVMNSIGMTRKQIRKMLMTEGIIYSGMSVVIAVVIILATSSMMKYALESVFWFIKYQFFILPVIVVGILIIMMGLGMPLLLYRRKNIEN